MRTHHLLTGLLLLAATLATGAHAQTEIERRRPAAARGAVSVENAFGTLTVRGWERNEVLVQGQLAAGAEELSFESEKGETWISVDVPDEWYPAINRLMAEMPDRISEYEEMLHDNEILLARSRDVGVLKPDVAINASVSGPVLRGSGIAWDIRKADPYCLYDRFDFDIPVGHNGDCFDRFLVRLEEMRQSLRIIEQCLNKMPGGDYKSRHPLTTPPVKKHTMHDIETLITHFLAVSWGPVIPPGEASSCIEATKGANSYYAISDGNTSPYRLRVRTPSFPHMQMIRYISKGYTVADLLSILGAMDYVLADIDR